MSQSKQAALALAESLEALTQYGNIPVMAGWAQHLQVAGNSPELYLALAVLFGRLMELRQALEASDQPQRAKDLYRGAIDHVAQFISPSFASAQTTGNVGQSIDKINLLHLLAAALPDEVVPDVQPATLETLTRELEEMLSGLSAVEMESELRGFVQSTLETLLMVLRSYKTFGPDGAARIYGSIAAEMARIVWQEPPRTEQGQSTLSKLLKLTKKVGAVVIWTSAVAGASDKLLTYGTDLADALTGPQHAEHGLSPAAKKAGPRNAD
jgi:hypothetical protein